MNKRKRTGRFSVRLANREREGLEVLALRDDVSASHIVRQAIRHILQRAKRG